MNSLFLVVFDLDDTLYPEVDFVKSGFRAVAKHLNDSGLIDAGSFYQMAWELFIGGTRGKIFNNALERLGVAFTPDQIVDLVSIYREHHPDISLFPDSLSLLKALKEYGCTLALVSDGPFQTQMNKIRALGLEACFDHLILTGAYGLDWGKPSPLAFLELMKKTGLEASKCVYVADNPSKDFLGPNRLGWFTIRVREKIGLYYDEMPVPDGEPREIVENLAALRQRLLSFIKQNQ